MTRPIIKETPFAKYTHLLIALLLILLAVPLTSHLKWHFHFFPCLVLVAILFAVRAMNLKRRLYFLGIFLIFLAFSLHMFAMTLISDWPRSLILIISDVIHGGIVVMAIGLMMRRILSESEVTIDTIQGGAAIYFLMGILWMLIYQVISIGDPKAFDILSADRANDFHLLYFSFVTLTTVGFGDIVPKNELAMVFSILEAIAGQFFIAVFIARLIGLHIVHHIKK